MNQRLMQLAVAALAAVLSHAQGADEVGGLKRQAQTGFGVREADGVLVIDRLEPGSAAARAGLADGDALVSLNGAALADGDQAEAAIGRLRAGDAVRLEVARDEGTRTVEFVAEAKPLEAIPGVVSHYGAVTTPDGARLRTIITAPAGDDARRYPLLFTQWVSCGSIEYRPGSNSRELLAALARESGLALVRVERSSDGDSLGPDCDQLDYDTEVNHYVFAFAQLLNQSDRLDPSRVFVYGSSLGSTTAPLVAKALQDAGADIAGVMVQGGGAVTYLERMLTFDRHYLERRPEAVRPEAIHEEILARARFHFEYLIARRHPDQVANDDPRMAAVRADVLGLGANDHYGRPFAWHQQAASRNFLAAWAAIDAPVLVIFNEFDQFEGRHGHRLIADTVNRLRPGTARYVERPRIGHSDNEYASIEAAYTRAGGTPAWQGAAEIMLAWLAENR